MILSNIDNDSFQASAAKLGTAQALDLATTWIDRQCLSRDGEWGATARVVNPPEPDFLFYSTSEMADAADTGR